MTWALALTLLLVGGCSKATETQEPAPQADDAPPASNVPVPLGSDGWPKDWPRHGVVFVAPDGTDGSYIRGAESDSSRAVRWRAADVEDAYKSAVLDAAIRRSGKEGTWVE